MATAKPVEECIGSPVCPSHTNQWQHPPSFYCPISQQCMRDPVVLSDGHSYERQYIERWLQDHSTSPVSGLQLLQKAVFPNHALRNAIEEYFHQVFSAHRRAIRRTMGGSLAQGSDPSVSLVRAIDALMQCSLLVNADVDVECVLRKIMDEAKTLLGAEAASVFLLDVERQELYSTVNSTGRELRIPVAVGIAGSVARLGEPLVVHSPYDDARFDRTLDVRLGFRTRNILCVPLKDRKGGIIGVAQLINKTASGGISAERKHCQEGTHAAACPMPEDAPRGDGFTADDLQFLTVFASQAAMAIVSSGTFMVSEPCVAGESNAPQPTASAEAISWRSTVEGYLKEPASAVKEHDADVNALLSHAFGSWEFDALELARLTANKPLSTLGMYLFDHLQLVATLGLNRNKLCSFLEAVERGYDDSNPYHNRAHAASVLHAMHGMLEHGGMMRAVAPALLGHEARPGEVDDAAGSAALERMTCLLAAAIHDYEHEGLNNDFLVKTGHKRAIRYNDQHVNELHHAAAAFALLLRPEYNFLEHLPAQDFRRVRSLAIELVLGTDMAQHGKIVQAVGDALDSFPCTEAGVQPESRDKAVLLLQLAMKCSDLGHLALEWGIHLLWVKRLEEEFFRQGDQEKQAELPVSFLMDRCKPGVSSSQTGFFDGVALPLFRVLARAVPGAGQVLAAVEANHARWTGVKGTPELAAQPERDETPRRAAVTPAATSSSPPQWSSEASVVPAPSSSIAGMSGTLAAAGGGARKRRSGRARQRAAKFWAAIRQPTPSPDPGTRRA